MRVLITNKCAFANLRHRLSSGRAYPGDAATFNLVYGIATPECPHPVTAMGQGMYEHSRTRPLARHLPGAFVWGKLIDSVAAERPGRRVLSNRLRPLVGIGVE
jgi:hypothetical protein